MTDGLANNEINGGFQTEKHPSPKNSEIKEPEKAIGIAEQKIIERIDKDGDPDLVLKDIADGITPQDLDISPFDQFISDQMSKDDTQVFGGEIIQPTAVRVDDPKNLDGTINPKAAYDRGWLSAITSATGKVELLDSERLSNIQEIVNAALAAGVSSEQLVDHLQTLGISITSPEKETPQTNSMDYAQENTTAQAADKLTEKTIQEDAKTETTKKDETTEAFQRQIDNFLQIVANDSSVQRTMQIFRDRTGTTDTDLQILSKMSQSMYEVVHKSAITSQALVDSLHVPNPDEYIKQFDSANPRLLREKVASVSGVRSVTEQELANGGQPDQAEHFVWFKGNAPYGADAREVRFYINASPEGTPTVAEKLAKISDFLDPNGIRLNFKFRKDFDEYTRTDTCVAYLYIPKTTTPEQNDLSNQWLSVVKEAMGKLPQDALRQQSSFFTHQIAEGVSFAEDTRDKLGKKDESYTSQITKVIAQTCGELSGLYSTLTPEAIQAISARAAEKLKQLNYI